MDFILTALDYLLGAPALGIGTEVGFVWKALLLLVALLIFTAYVLLADRKIWAAVQMRRGPNVVGAFGLLQSFADLLKFVFKEPLLPAGADKIVFLLAPLRGGDDEAAFADDDAAPRARDEREHLYESIRDLDHDYETGKLDEEGWRSLRGELRARAVTLLAEERAHAEASPPAAPAAPAPPATCRTCGAEPRPGDRFCAGCGAPLAASPAATSPATGSDGDEAPPA